MMEDLDLTPEELQQILALSGLNEQGDLLKRQLAQAEALRDAQWASYSTPEAATLAGFGNVARGLRGMFGSLQAEGKLSDLQKQREAARLLYLHGMGRGRSRLPAPGDMPIPGLPGLDPTVA